MIDRRIRNSVDGVEGAPDASTLYTTMMSGLRDGTFQDPFAAESYVLDPQNWGQNTEEVVTNPPGTMLTRMLGWDDGIPDATEMRPVGPPVVQLPQSGGGIDPAAAIADARAAIAANPANRTEVLRRLAANGIDPSGLGL